MSVDVGASLDLERFVHDIARHVSGSVDDDGSRLDLAVGRAGNCYRLAVNRALDLGSFANCDHLRSNIALYAALELNFSVTFQISGNSQ